MKTNNRVWYFVHEYFSALLPSNANCGRLGSTSSHAITKKRAKLLGANTRNLILAQKNVYVQVIDFLETICFTEPNRYRTDFFQKRNRIEKIFPEPPNTIWDCNRFQLIIGHVR